MPVRKRAEWSRGGLVLCYKGAGLQPATVFDSLPMRWVVWCPDGEGRWHVMMSLYHYRKESAALSCVEQWNRVHPKDSQMELVLLKGMYSFVERCSADHPIVDFLREKQRDRSPQLRRFSQEAKLRCVAAEEQHAVAKAESSLELENGRLRAAMEYLEARLDMYELEKREAELPRPKRAALGLARDAHVQALLVKPGLGLVKPGLAPV